MHCPPRSRMAGSAKNSKKFDEFYNLLMFLWPGPQVHSWRLSMITGEATHRHGTPSLSILIGIDAQKAKKHVSLWDQIF